MMYLEIGDSMQVYLMYNCLQKLNVILVTLRWLPQFVCFRLEYSVVTLFHVLYNPQFISKLLLYEIWSDLSIGL